MHLDKIQVINFKNCESAELSFSPKINCFLGNNGQGKTNMLDAIFYLAYCKSFFNPSDSQLIRYDEAFMLLKGDFIIEGKKENIHCGLKRGQKKQFKRNKKEYDRLSDHIGLIGVVMISPEDSQLIHEGSEVRRRFLDLVIAQYNRQYLESLIQYNKALAHRNRLLKKMMETRRFDEDTLVIWDEQLIQYGRPVFEARKAFVQQFVPLFQNHYDFISKGGEQVSLTYDSPLIETDFAEALIAARDKDRRRTYSTVGVHKDDLLFQIDERPIKKFGSQGQQKTYLLALKLAQAEFLNSEKKRAPILLLDDIYDKLDEERVAKLMEQVQKDFIGQVFISDTHLERLPNLFSSLNADARFFEVNKGELSHV